MEILKNELAGALSALGKLVCRTSPLEAYRSLRIEGKENKIAFQTAGLDESITCTVPVEGGAEFCVFVNFDNFRTVAKFSRNKSLVVEYEQGKFSVDHCLLPTVNVEWPKVSTPATDAMTTELPENFLSVLPPPSSTGTSLAGCCRVSTSAGTGSSLPTARNCSISTSRWDLTR